METCLQECTKGEKGEGEQHKKKKLSHEIRPGKINLSPAGKVRVKGGQATPSCVEEKRGSRVLALRSFLHSVAECPSTVSATPRPKVQSLAIQGQRLQPRVPSSWVGGVRVDTAPSYCQD